MALSPMMQHYLETKEKHKDSILFYRLGDFYEMFFDDAKKVSDMLDLTLTGKDCGLNERAPMCGIPYHAADEYIAKLVAMGEKVAICEQLSEPNGKDLVVREVVRVVTAGTITNNELIDDKNNNFLCCVCIKDNQASMSKVDITTGEFFTCPYLDDNFFRSIIDDLCKVNPAEIICNVKAFEMFKDLPLVTHGVLPKFKTYTESEFDYNLAEKVLFRQFRVGTLKPFGFTDNDISVCSAGALISYLFETQKRSLININNITKENKGQELMLDINAIRNLELTKTLRDGKRYGSLIWLLDKTKTSMGARKLSSWILSPLNDINSINYRLDAVECLFNNTVVMQGLSNVLGSIKDIGRIAGRIANGILTPNDCKTLKTSLAVLPNIKFRLSGLQSQFIKDIDASLYDFSSIVTLLDNAIVDEPPNNVKDGGFIKEGYNAEFDEIKSIFNDSSHYISKLENEQRAETGIKNLKIGYNRIFGYYFEVSNSFKNLVPYNYQRRQTVANGERYITEELKDLEVKILTAQEKSLDFENKLFEEIKEILSKNIQRLQESADAIASLDVVNAFAIVARENNYVKPNMLPFGERLDIVEGRHPVVEKIAKTRFVPNDCLLDCKENRIMILTGPNMAGKSTYMRQVALITLMAHFGCFVPCKSAEIPLTDKIFTRVGASDNLISDQSTFMVEMTEMAEILKNSTKNSLIILDEIGRGTSTYDGLSIAMSIIETILNKIGAKTLFATHYHELTELEEKMQGVKNYKVTVKEMPEGIIFLRKIMRGGANRSFGIEVAELSGIDKDVIIRARQILKGLEANKNKYEVKEKQETVENKLSETERIIKDLDINNLSPMQAFNVLSDLYEKVNKQ